MVIGVGNDLRGDDALGLVVARRLKKTVAALVPGAEVVESRGDAAELIDLWTGRDEVLVIDAFELPSGTAGEILEFDATVAPLPAPSAACSTHALSLSQAVELSRVLGTLPRQLTILGAVGAVFGMAQGLSPAIAAAADRLVVTIERRLNPGGETPCTNIP